MFEEEEVSPATARWLEERWSVERQGYPCKKHTGMFDGACDACRQSIRKQEEDYILLGMIKGPQTSADEMLYFLIDRLHTQALRVEAEISEAPEKRWFILEHRA